MPDILDMLTVSVEAGLGFDAALAQITRYGRGPVAGEFARVLQEMQIGRSRVDALRALGQRTNVAELKSFCAIVVQASELGVPIANVLREQSKEMRIRRRQRAEELAQKVPVKILFPLIFCLFPADLHRDPRPGRDQHSGRVRQALSGPRSARPGCPASDSAGRPVSDIRQTRWRGHRCSGRSGGSPPTASVPCRMDSSCWCGLPDAPAPGYLVVAGSPCRACAEQHGVPGNACG